MTNGYSLGDDALARRLDDRLAAVEVMLRESVKSDYPFVTETSRHLVDAGGKRFRPMLVLLAAEFGDAASRQVLQAAVVVELTHLATLYHDDVMDEAQRRRGTESANARWDNTVAILTGDFLFSKASDILSELGPAAVRIQARTFERLVIGQIKETVGPNGDGDPVHHHLGVLEDKTGSLIATSGRFGAMFAGCDESVVDTLTLFGERIGVAFQLADDLVDLTSEDGQSGKTQGTDLREGIQTLPALLALASAGPGDERLLELLGRPLPDDDEHAEALALLLAHDAVGQARAEARRWADEARATLAALPDIAARDALERLCDYVVTRTA
ncbi:MAG: hypothetical protein QG671_2097 [Actinomycetota bacterium]|nr:hypothetical protein [Actinomycetota bacterium]HQZ84644.1 polyprenyl synthetase family protein [Actinomycetota bacterium]